MVSFVDKIWPQPINFKYDARHFVKMCIGIVGVSITPLDVLSHLYLYCFVMIQRFLMVKASPSLKNLSSSRMSFS